MCEAFKYGGMSPLRFPHGAVLFLAIVPRLL